MPLGLVHQKIGKGGEVNQDGLVKRMKSFEYDIIDDKLVPSKRQNK